MSEAGLGRIGRYRLLRLLAQGGMGQVWEASRVDRPEERVALKLLVANDLTLKQARMFLDEARIGAMLEHPNLVRVLDLGLEGSSPYLVMERLEGKPLSSLLHGEVMPVGLVVGIALQALEALGYAHAAQDGSGRPLGIVHRDIKPSNLFVCTSGTVRVLDFGIAQLSGRTCSTRGSVAGSLPYCSPEQLQEQPVDARSDLFSLGAVLHEMLTGRRLFDRQGSGAIISAIVYGATPPVSGQRPEVPPALDRTISACLAKDPGARPPGAGAVAESLRRALAEHEVWDASRIAVWLESQPAERREGTHPIAVVPAPLAPPVPVPAPPDEGPSLALTESAGPRPPGGARQTTPLRRTPPEDGRPRPGESAGRHHRVEVARRRMRSGIALGSLFVVTAIALAAGRGVFELRAQSEGAGAPGFAESGTAAGRGSTPRDEGRLARIAPAAAGMTAPVPRGEAGEGASSRHGAELGAAPNAPPAPSDDDSGARAEGEAAVEAVARRERPGLFPEVAKRPMAPPRNTSIRKTATRAERAHTGGGWINVDSRPVWATVWLDGKQLGPTPLYRQSVEAGSHRIEATLADGRRQTKSVVVEPAAEKTVILLW